MSAAAGTSIRALGGSGDASGPPGPLPPPPPPPPPSPPCNLLNVQLKVLISYALVVVDMGGLTSGGVV
jgi:hypothetical protein